MNKITTIIIKNRWCKENLNVHTSRIQQRVEQNIKTNTNSVTLSSQYLKVSRYLFFKRNSMMLPKVYKCFSVSKAI